MTSTTTPADVVRAVAAARSATGTQEYLAQTRCVDWLLDCFNAAVRPTVRSTVEDALRDIVHVNLVRGVDFQASLDLIELAADVDTAFDHLDLDAQLRGAEIAR
jgi:hypothetical protein